MGRKEERLLKKRSGEKLGKKRTSGPLIPLEENLLPFSAENGPMLDFGDGPADGMIRPTHLLTDDQLNRVIVGNMKGLEESGNLPPWPEDDFGCTQKFAESFLTP